MASVAAAAAGPVVPAAEPGAEEPQSLVAGDKQELTDEQFTMYLMNEDTVCPRCHKPFLPWREERKDQEGEKPVPEDGKEVEGMVKPLRLDCQHAICRECARDCYEKDVAFMNKGCVRCQFQKRDQLGNGPFTCRFVTECDVDKDGYPVLEESQEIRLICKALRGSGVLVGTDPDFCPFFWYKVCHGCGKPATRVTKTEPRSALCDTCFGKDESEFWTIEGYEKEVVRVNKCCKCGKEAIMYCAKCEKYYCKDRNCYDACKDPDHVLVTFLPNISEMKRQEYQDIESSRKMFLNDVHEYNDPNPFMRRLYDLECFRKAIFSLAKIKFERDEKPKEPKTEDAEPVFETDE